jgi:hypothetical protein
VLICEVLERTDCKLDKSFKNNYLSGVWLTLRFASHSLGSAVSATPANNRGDGWRIVNPESAGREIYRIHGTSDISAGQGAIP